MSATKERLVKLVHGGNMMTCLAPELKETSIGTSAGRAGGGSWDRGQTE